MNIAEIKIYFPIFNQQVNGNHLPIWKVRTARKTDPGY